VFVFVGAITSPYNEPRPPLYLRPEPVPREGNMGEQNEGLSVFDLDMATGALRHIQAVRGVRNPTFLALHPTLPLLYAAERETTTWGPIEAMAGGIVTFEIGADGQLTQRDRMPVGFGATYISAHPSGRYLFTAMPAPHSVAVFPVRPDGRVDPAIHIVQHQGRGVNTITLERPFPHSIRPDAAGRRVLAADMGLDRIIIYDLDEDTGRLAPAEHPYAQTNNGAGPRHLWVHPTNRWVYVVNEIDASVAAFSYDADSARMRIVNTVSTRPEGFEGHNTGAQIVVHPSGRFVYSSNRGHNSIAMLSIDQETGRTRLLGLEPTQGLSPRNFNIDPTGQFLVAGNGNSDTLISFRIDQESGLLAPTGAPVSSPHPVCVMFFAAGGAQRSS
jgi:6-phosphogluconolactonase